MMGDDWLTDELMQRARNLILDIDGIASQGSVYVVSRALYEERKRGREEERERCAKVAYAAIRREADDYYDKRNVAASVAAAIRSGQ